MYAIIETGGKQIRVEKDAVIFVEKLEANEGDTVTFELERGLKGMNAVRVTKVYIALAASADCCGKRLNAAAMKRMATRLMLISGTSFFFTLLNMGSPGHGCPRLALACRCYHAVGN